MDLLFLGTGSGVPAKHRNVSSIALKLLEERNSVWMFDCGEATQHQILHTTLKPRKIEKIFITHMHGDHIFGLPGLLSSRAFQGGDTLLTIYGPVGIKQYVLSCLRYSGTHIKYPIKFVEFNDGDTIFDDNQFKVTVRKLKHGMPSFGFRIEEADHEGTLQAEKLKAAGVPFGPLFGKLKNGETVTLEDGREVDGRDFVGPTQKGRTIAILGDTVKTDASKELALNADVLVHESTFNHADVKLASSYNHSTNVQAAEIARDARVKKLLLTHISARYLSNDVYELQKEAQCIFTETYVMHDLKEISIPLEKEGDEHK
ncbi:ribonuclease Z [Marinilactibacillus kalidii]|uniref:ribonuclease Z n=1 Tax=Marinilactibacillus kalidii TaxID=2820274 RepID=UPI001ABDBA21|nr:ribonuclease Z [Marinilactibacillus kalidii]